MNCISRWNFCSFHGVHRKAITYKLSDVTSGFPLRLPLYFSREQISPRTISSRFPILYPKGLAWPYILSLVLHPTFRREKKFRLISRIDSVHRAKMRACILHRFRARHMHCRRATTEHSRLLYSASNIFHKGHSCMNRIPNINRRSGLPRSEREERDGDPRKIYVVV